MEGNKSLVVESKSLHELFSNLSKSQRMYLSLSLRGMSHDEAKDVAKVRTKTVVDWGEDFRKVASLVLSRKDREAYQREALEIFTGNLSVKAQELVDMLIDKGLYHWDESDRYDKNCIMQAVKLAAPRGSGKEPGGTYEELIMRRRIES